MEQNFMNSVKMERPRSNRFDLSHDVKLTTQFGWLTPSLAMDVIPGDHIDIGCDSLVRMAPMLAPVMHRIDVSMHYFFVPYRLLWDNWENFITNTKVGGAVPAFPTIDMTTAIFERLDDFLGVAKPTGAGTLKINPMFHAAYQFIYNEYYRDQNLITEVPYKLSDGSNVGIQNHLQALRKRAWEHDMFTSCLPFAQKGPAVDLPLGIVELDPNWSSHGTPTFQDSFGAFPTGNVEVSNVPGDPIKVGATMPTAYDPANSLIVGPTTINDLRRAEALQKFLEKNARGGTRYTEHLKVHHGVTSSDKRLQRPEYITGIKSPIVISEVLNTGGDDATNIPQGNMAGHGAGVVLGKYGRYYAEENGCIIGIMSVMPKSNYQQGMPKFFSKTVDFTDYFFPAFANLGEQVVDNTEIYADPGQKGNPFGYLPIYYEYRTLPNRTAGDFKTTLDYWTLTRIFSSQPVLNQSFIECDHTPLHRIFAVTSPTDDKLWCQVLHKINAVRNVPKYGTPSF